MPRRLLTNEAVNSMCIQERPTLTLVGHTHWQTEPECNGDSDCFIVKAQPTEGYREHEQPVPAVGELCSLEGSSLCKVLKACFNQGTVPQDSWMVPEWLFDG